MTDTPNSPNKEEDGRRIIYISTPITLAEDSDLTRKDMYNIYWRCRDFEINHLWQRSIFLTAFLVLCFTAYGILIKDMFDALLCNNINDIYWLLCSLAAMAICLIGTVLSCLWIMMAKGSKAWYEIYEAAITAYEKESYFSNQKKDGLLEKIKGYQYINLNNYKEELKPIDQKLNTGTAGAYSPSRINWAIGFLMLVICQFLAFIHAVMLGVATAYIITDVAYKYVAGLLVAIIALTTNYVLFYKIRHYKKLESEQINKIHGKSN